MKDETLSHVPLFKGIFRTIVAEVFHNKVPNTVMIKLHQMIKDMTVAEKRWSKYALRDMKGSSDRAIDLLVEGQANSVCRNLMIPELFETARTNPLKKLLLKNLKGGISSRTNFFEGNVVDYDKVSLIVDF